MTMSTYEPCRYSWTTGAPSGRSDGRRSGTGFQRCHLAHFSIRGQRRLKVLLAGNHREEGSYTGEKLMSG
ncbi:unnamed protein product [Boreogadus saida]